MQLQAEVQLGDVVLLKPGVQPWPLNQQAEQGAVGRPSIEVSIEVDRTVIAPGDSR